MVSPVGQITSSQYVVREPYGSQTFYMLSSVTQSTKYSLLGFPGGSEVKASACNVGGLCSIPGLGRSPGEGNGNPLQYSCLENPMDGGAWWAAVHGVAQSQTRLMQLSSSSVCIAEGNGNPLQCSCLENPRDGGAWWAAAYGVAQSQTRLT